jgi:hypothetical protein
MNIKPAASPQSLAVNYIIAVIICGCRCYPTGVYNTDVRRGTGGPRQGAMWGSMGASVGCARGNMRERESHRATHKTNPGG